MRVAVLFLFVVPAWGCAFFGSLVHGGTTALGAAGGAAVAGPAGAAVGGIAGFYGGDLAAEQITGTRSVRVGTDGKVPDPVGASGSLAGTITQAAGIPNMDTMLLLLIAVAFVALGGPAWLRSRMAQTDADRKAHREETARLRKEVDEIWDRLPPR